MLCIGSIQHFGHAAILGFVHPVNRRDKQPLRIAVLSYTTISHDHRILRTLEALAGLGHKVTAIGFGEPPALPVDMIRLPDPPEHNNKRLAILATQFPANFLPMSAPFLHFRLPQHGAARRALVALRPDIIHANDWQALVAAAAAKAAAGSSIVYDSHELASEEHADNWLWRLVSRRHTCEIETRYIREACAVITVSDGIAATLQDLYALPELPLVIRNTPAYQAVVPSATTPPIKLLFHGIMKDGRGIEPLIGAMPMLPKHRLTLRGDGAPHYLAKLRALTESLGVAGHVKFEPAVPYDEVVSSAASSHIGVFCAPLDTRHNRFAMPNKAYEYIMAGLAILVTDHTELAKLVREHRCGFTAIESTPRAIAEALNALSLSDLATMGSHALAAARTLSWEQEQKKLVTLYETLAANIALRHID